MPKPLITLYTPGNRKDLIAKAPKFKPDGLVIDLEDAVPIQLKAEARRDMGTLIPTLGDDVRSAVWKVLYVGFFAGPISLGSHGPRLLVLYSIVPWIGVMAAGHALSIDHCFRMADFGSDRGL